MTLRPHISYRDVSPTPALEELIQAEVAKLEHFFNRISNCRVHVENTRPHRPNGSAFHVRVELSVPGEHLVVNQTDDIRPLTSPGDDEADRGGKPAERPALHKDSQVAVRDAFRIAASRLQDYVAQRRDARPAP